MKAEVMVNVTLKNSKWNRVRKWLAMRWVTGHHRRTGHDDYRVGQGRPGLIWVYCPECMVGVKVGRYRVLVDRKRLPRRAAR